MCGIAGQLNLLNESIPDLNQGLMCMSSLLVHRGPDGFGIWTDQSSRLGFAHRRLSVIDLSKAAFQPMSGPNKSTITFNGEIYNYEELRKSLQGYWNFNSKSDTECILAAFEKYGLECLSHFRGMFSFALWDEKSQELFCARDRFGIKPLYYMVVNDIFYFASEVKALLPFLSDIKTNEGSFAEYLTFQYNIGEETLFQGVRQLLPGHALLVKNGKIKLWKYWDVSYEIDFDNSPIYFENRLKELLVDSIKIHGRSDVPVGNFISGGIDSSLIFSLAKSNSSSAKIGFHGRFTESLDYDESNFAELATKHGDGLLHTVDITAQDFKNHIEQVIYHLDYPVAGPGAFAQFMVSKLASNHVKVVMAGQGGDEVFGGYARYVIAYLEQSLKAAIDGNYKNGNYVVTIESIIPNLGLLREYKPLIKQFWSQGLFDSMDQRYFRLINRSLEMHEEIHWDALNMSKVFENFSVIFNNPSNVTKEAYLDKMTHFDFKCLLPALLHVEDRMSMAHGLESRVPFLDHSLIEFAATIPADVKFKGGNLKHLLKNVFRDKIHPEIYNRRDKMGFPVPLREWFSGELKEFAMDTFNSMACKQRSFINSDAIMRNLGTEKRFSRKIWGLMSLEIWHQQYHDKASVWRNKSKNTQYLPEH
jgi:asparagine synthase (glutamine-hydrolysing)